MVTRAAARRSEDDACRRIGGGALPGLGAKKRPRVAGGGPAPTGSAGSVGGASGPAGELRALREEYERCKAAGLEAAALECLRKACRVKSELFGAKSKWAKASEVDFCKCANVLATALLRQGDLERASQLLLDAHEVACKDPQSEAATLVNIAVCMYSQEMVEDALHYLDLARETQLGFGAVEEDAVHGKSSGRCSFRGEAHLGRSAALFKAGDSRRALFHAQSAARFAQEQLRLYASQRLPECFLREALVVIALAYHALALCLRRRGAETLREPAEPEGSEEVLGVGAVLSGVKFHIKAYEEVAVAHAWAVPAKLQQALWQALLVACRESREMARDALRGGGLRPDYAFLCELVAQQSASATIQCGARYFLVRRERRAALRIQAASRRHLARRTLAAKREARASAVKLQAAFRGHQARKLHARPVRRARSPQHANATRPLDTLVTPPASPCASPKSAKSRASGSPRSAVSSLTTSPMSMSPSALAPGSIGGSGIGGRGGGGGGGGGGAHAGAVVTALDKLPRKELLRARARADEQARDRERQILEEAEKRARQVRREQLEQQRAARMVEQDLASAEARARRELTQRRAKHGWSEAEKEAMLGCLQRWRRHDGAREGLRRLWAHAVHERRSGAATCLQASWRRHVWRQDFLQLKAVQDIIQKAYRGYAQRRKHKLAAICDSLRLNLRVVPIQRAWRARAGAHKHRSAACIQAAARGRAARKEYRRALFAAVQVQKLFRGYNLRRFMNEFDRVADDAVLTIQAWTRGSIARKQVAVMRADKAQRDREAQLKHEQITRPWRTQPMGSPFTSRGTKPRRPSDSAIKTAPTPTPADADSTTRARRRSSR